MLITWFEIPVKDYDKSKKFYTEIFGFELNEMEMDGKKFGMFPSKPEQTGGAIVQGEGYAPNSDGVLIFLSAGDDVANVLNKVEPAGGKVVVPKTKVNDEVGTIGIFIDNEGNKIGLHTHP